VWFVTGSCGQILDLAHNRFSIDDFAENNMFLIEVGSRDCGNEELRAIGA